MKAANKISIFISLTYLHTKKPAIQELTKRYATHTAAFLIDLLISCDKVHLLNLDMPLRTALTLLSLKSVAAQTLQFCNFGVVLKNQTAI